MTLYAAHDSTGPVTGTRSQYMSVCILAALMQGLDGFTVVLSGLDTGGEMDDIQGESETEMEGESDANH